LVTTSPAEACTPPEVAPFNDVVEPRPDVEESPSSFVGVVERHVVVHAPAVPVLSTSRSVWVRSRVWGDVSGVAVPDRRHGEYFGAVFRIVSFCPAPPAPRSGDVTMTAVVEHDDGTRRSIRMASEPNRLDPTFPGGLTDQQRAALDARFGAPDVAATPPRRSLIAWWLWVWRPWLIIAAMTAIAVGIVWLTSFRAPAPGALWDRTARGSVPPPPPAHVAWQPGGPGPAGQTGGSNRMALAALVLGIGAFVLSLVPVLGAFLAIPLGIVAIILGVLGHRRAKRTTSGIGLAVGGLVTGMLAILIALVWL
jgi:hypothetical protein